MSTRRLIDEYLRKATQRGRVVHLVHFGEFQHSDSPQAQCGTTSDPYWWADEDGLPLCKKCAQHVNDRGVPGSDLYPELAQ